MTVYGDHGLPVGVSTQLILALTLAAFWQPAPLRWPARYAPG
jgi:hypothetical protein